MRRTSLLPIMTDQVFHTKILITCTGFSLQKSKLAAVLTGDLRHHPHRRNSPLKHHPSEALSVEIQCHFIFNQKKCDRLPSQMNNTPLDKAPVFLKNYISTLRPRKQFSGWSAT